MSEENVDKDLEAVPSPSKLKKNSPFKPSRPVKIEGKTLEELKEEVIPALKKKIRSLGVQVCVTKKKLEELRLQSSKRTKRSVQLAVNRTQRYERKKNRITKHRLMFENEKYFKSRMNIYLMQHYRYIDSILYYPVLYREQIRYPFTHTMFRIFIIVCHFKWFNIKDIERFGFNTNYGSTMLKKLYDVGYLDRYQEGRVNVYLISKKGKSVFNSIKLKCQKLMNEVIKRSPDNIKIKYKAVKKESDSYARRQRLRKKSAELKKLKQGADGVHPELGEDSKL